MSIDRVLTPEQKARMRAQAPRGEARVSSKLTEIQVRAIIRQLPGKTNQELATAFDVSTSTISAIRQGRTWRHIWERK